MITAQTGFFSSARVTGLMQGITDPRLLPQRLTWSERIPDVPGVDGEISAKYVGTMLIADIIADDQKAGTYTQGRFQYQTTQVPNIKMGISMNQSMIAELDRIQAQGGIPNDDTGIFNNKFAKMVQDAKFGVEMRKEVLLIAMLLDGLDYDRLGIKMSGVTWGMYSDLKVTPSIAWSSVSATPLTDIATVRAVAMQRYGANLDRATMTTPQLRAMVATTEYTNQVKNVNFAVLLGAPTQTAPLTPDTILRRQAEMIISGGIGEPFTIEIDDRRYWAQSSSGAITSNRFQPNTKVILTSTANDGNSSAYDFLNCPVIESALTGAFPSSVVGEIPRGRGPVGYMTLSDSALNPPGVVCWGVRRGFPRKHSNASSAVLSVGTLTETYDTSLPATF